MLLLALRGLIGARRRLLATGAAVALGVALAAGALVLGRAIDRSLEASAAAPARAADVVVRQQVALRSALGPVRSRLPGSVVDLVRDTPGVGVAEGVVQGYAQPLDGAGTPLAGPSTNPSRLGLPWLAQPALNPWHLVAGTPPHTAEEVVVDAGTARRAGLQLGQVLDVALTSGRVPYRLVGVAALAGR
jgi:putative ABC transport system permease protein